MNLDADLEVEVSSGEKRIIKQGEVFFVEDTKGKQGRTQGVRWVRATPPPGFVVHKI